MPQTTYLTVLLAVCFALLGCKTAANSTPQSNPIQAAPQTANSPSKLPSNETARRQSLLNSASVFDAILPSLKAKTKVPLRLPAYLAAENETHPLYAIIEAVSPSEYEIQLAFTQDCSGGNTCHYGTVSGRTKRVKESSPRGQRVSLANGLSGYFVEATCGAVCSESTLTWDQDGYRYAVGLKAEKVETLRKVADSAIVK